MTPNSQLPPSTSLSMKILRMLRRKRLPERPSALLDAATIRARGCLVAPLEQIEDELERMVDDGWVEKSECLLHGDPAPAKWELSRATIRLMEEEEAEAREQFNNILAAEPEEGAPLSVTVCHRAEPEDRKPAVAMLCINEDELDGWWDALDVEAKADAFSQWSLANDGSNCHLYLGPSRGGIPLVGAIGES